MFDQKVRTQGFSGTLTTVNLVVEITTFSFDRYTESRYRRTRIDCRDGIQLPSHFALLR